MPLAPYRAETSTPSATGAPSLPIGLRFDRPEILALESPRQMERRALRTRIEVPSGGSMQTRPTAPGARRPAASAPDRLASAIPAIAPDTTKFPEETPATVAAHRFDERVFLASRTQKSQPDSAARSKRPFPETSSSLAFLGLSVHALPPRKNAPRCHIAIIPVQA